MKSIRLIILWMIAFITGIFLTAYGNEQLSDTDIVKFEGHEYLLLEYPANIFYFYYNGNDEDNFEEVDGIYAIASPQWKMIWNGGDLYCAKENIKEANSYYADSENYDWYVAIDSEDKSNVYPVEVTNTELNHIYELENKPKEMSLFYEEFETLGSLFKVSKDGIVRGTISIVEYEDQWYWNSETIDESKESENTWPEYVQPLPESLSIKIQLVK